MQQINVELGIWEPVRVIRYITLPLQLIKNPTTTNLLLYSCSSAVHNYRVAVAIFKDLN